MQPITILIRDNNKTIQVPWQPDINAKEALEKAYDQEKEMGRSFDFALRYFGSPQGEYLGYLVIMIDNIYDNPKDTNDYWLFYVNGKLSSVGIDSYMVNQGDLLEFDYIPYDETVHSHTLQELKHKIYHS